MRWRGVCLAAISLFLSSCQPPVYDIFAVVRGTDLVFEARGAGMWPFRDDDGVGADRVEVRDRDRIIWAIERDPGHPGCKPNGPTPPFPLVYGRTPACYREKVKAEVPIAGALHRIDGEGARRGSGLFRPGQKVTNVDWSDAEEELRGWRELADPFFPPERGNGRPLPADEVDASGANAATSNVH